MTQGRGQFPAREGWSRSPVVQRVHMDDVRGPKMPVPPDLDTSAEQILKWSHVGAFLGKKSNPGLGSARGRVGTGDREPTVGMT